MSIKKYVRSLLRKYIGYDIIEKKGKYIYQRGVNQKPTELTFLEHKLYTHDIASYNLCVKELFEEEMYKFKAKTESPYIIDCGANMGMSMIYFKQLYPKAKVLAFEADAYIFSFLEKNKQSFGYDKVELVNKAVWHENTTLSFWAEGGAGGRIDRNAPAQNKVEVPAVRLRDYLNAEKVDFLKIDIEGAEFEVIKDCADLLPTIDTLFIEYHSFDKTPQNLHEILKIVAEAGFRYHIKEAYTTTFPYIEHKLNAGMDLQLNIFCYKD